jgi:hypothetical protein
MLGVCKALLAADEVAPSTGHTGVLDHACIAEHTHGFEKFGEAVRALSWG